MRYFDRDAMLRPRILDSARFQRARGEIQAYLDESDERRQRQRRAPYDAALLRHPEIKQAMRRGFGPACAFCESDTRSFEFIDIEHHRPKFGASGAKGQTEPLYYVWLAYDWDNLYPICRICNTAKKNAFPVSGNRGAIGASVDQLRQQEQALLLDPCFHDPSHHLSFDLSGMATARTQIGEISIRVLDLNRKSLVLQRCRQIAQVLATLQLNPSIATVPTGLAKGWGAFVFAEGGGEAMPHAGATTLAILEFAERTMPRLADITDFLVRWSDLPNDGKHSFYASAEPEPREQPTPASDTAQPDSKAQGSRLLRLEDVPSAERPIQKIRIRNFKALASIDLALPAASSENSEFSPCMLILGENATGKSSVLEAVALALLGTREIRFLDGLVATDAITPDEFIHRPEPSDWDVIAEGPISVDVRFLGIEQAVSISGGAGDAAFSGTGLPSKILLAYGPRRYFPSHQARRFRAPAHRARSLFDPMATITNPIGWLRDLYVADPVKFDAAIRSLRIVLMLKSDALIGVDDGRIMIDTEQGSTPLEKLSVGYKSVIAMVMDIIRELFAYYDNLENAYAVVLIDEIETHLHPRWKLRIVGLLRQAFPRVQFILTTHDPLCLRGTHQGEVFVLRRSEDDNAIETLAELPNVQGMRAEQILTSEFFGLGSTDPVTDAKVERYQYLTTKSDASADERSERLRLAGEIEARMMVGNTIEQQTDAEAARLANLDAPIALKKVEAGDRKRMVEAALAKLRAPLDDPE